MKKFTITYKNGKNKTYRYFTPFFKKVLEDYGKIETTSNEIANSIIKA